jgi:hypothetical protein
MIEGDDATFIINGYDKDDNLLESAALEDLAVAKIYSHRFAYDHVFIDRITLTYTGQEAVAAVDYVSIYALQ